MRYDIDTNNYITDVYFNCNSGTCVEYTGTIPSGYETLEEWSEKANIRAYKIVDGNLVYDENKDKELQRQFEIENEENQHATHKWVNDKFKNINMIYDDELSSIVDGSSLFSIENTKELEIVSMKVTPNEFIRKDLKINITNENILENKSVSQTINGVEFKVNEDKTITLNGTSTEEIEFILNGTLTNQDILFFFKKNTNYIKSGFNKNVVMNLYYYDGTNRELVTSGENEVISFTDTKYITCASLKIASGKTFKNVKISPMLSTGNIVKPYVEHKGNITTIDLYGYNFKGMDYIVIEREDLTFYKYVNIYPSKKLYPSKNLFPLKNKETIINGIINSLKTVDGTTTIQCDKDVNFEVRYFPKDYLNEKFSIIENREDEIEIAVGKKVGKNEVIASINASIEEEGGSLIKIHANKLKLEGYTTINDGFSVDEQGNMTCNGATASDLSIEGGNINLNDTADISNAALNITSNDNTYKTRFCSRTISIYETNDHSEASISPKILLLDGGGSSFTVFNESDDPTNNYVEYTTNGQGIFKATGTGFTYYTGSLEKLKKNIKKSNLGLDLIKNTDIYTYNYKKENDAYKKHIGVVIGDKYKTPTEILNNENTGIDTYSMVSVCFNAIKQLNSKIEQLENRIKELESDINV